MHPLKNNQYEVIDNLLNVDEFSSIKDYLSGSDFPWYYQSSVAEHGQATYPEFYFTHTLYNADTTFESLFFSICAPVIAKLKIATLIRVKANMYPNLGRTIINQPHVDFPFKHMGAVFYVNNNDGYTILENGTTIESKENRVLIFDASTSHQSTHCTDQKVRININFNYFGV